MPVRHLAGIRTESTFGPSEVAQPGARRAGFHVDMRFLFSRERSCRVMCHSMHNYFSKWPRTHSIKSIILIALKCVIWWHKVSHNATTPSPFLSSRTFTSQTEMKPP